MNSLWDRLRAGFGELGGGAAGLARRARDSGRRLFPGSADRALDRCLLQRLNFNKVAEAGGLSEAMERVGPRLDPVHAVGKLLFWLVMLVVILLASAALGLESINEMFGTMLSYIPTLIAAIVIVILGMIVGEFVRGLVLASAGRVEGVPTLAKVAKATVVLIAVFMAMQQLGVAAEIVTATFTVILGAVGLAAGLAFGPGQPGARRRDHPALVRRRPAGPPSPAGNAGGSSPDGSPPADSEPKP